MELIDVLDEKGNKTGESKPRLEVHRDGNWHRVIHVFFINSKKEILIQLRSKDKESFPDMWDCVAGGHISSNQEPEDAVIREIKEEIGIDINPTGIKMLGEVTQEFVLNNGTYIDNEFVNVYLVKEDLNINDFKLLDGEVQDIKWISSSELKRWIKEKNSKLVSRPKDFDLLFKVLEKTR